VQATWRWAFSFSRMMLPVSSPTEFETSWMTYDFHIIQPLKRTYKVLCLCHRTICRRILYSGLGSSPKNYLQMEYANLFTTVTPNYLWWFFLLQNSHLLGFSCTYLTQKHEKSCMNSELSLHSNVLKCLFWKTKLCYKNFI
jgi:hypothetical protein